MIGRDSQVWYKPGQGCGKGAVMGEIKTDMFPEVLRLKAKEKRENYSRKESSENTQGSVFQPIESIGNGKNRQEK